MSADLRAAAVAARGFMPADEGDALWDAGIDAGRSVPDQPFLEIGSYCGKSSVYLGAAARAAGTVLFALDHHRGSEENQPGWEWHEPDLVDPAVGPHRHAAVVPAHDPRRRPGGRGGGGGGRLADGRPPLGDARSPCCSSTAVTASSRPTATTSCWTPHVAPGGLLAIHDVFPDPADGGRPPYEIYRRALASGRFSEWRATGSLQGACELTNRVIPSSAQPTQASRSRSNARSSSTLSSAGAGTASWSTNSADAGLVPGEGVGGEHDRRRGVGGRSSPGKWTSSGNTMPVQ